MRPSHILVLLALATATLAQGPRITLEPGVNADRVLTVAVDSSPLVTATAVYWGKDWGWVGTEIAVSPPEADGARPTAFRVADLGISGDGRIVPEGERALRWEWDLRNERDFLEGSDDEPGRKAHGGLAFFLDLTSAARGGCTAEPVLFADGTGWSWEMTTGRTLTVAFAEPLADLYFERGQKTEIRAMFHARGVHAGETPIRMVVTVPEGGSVVTPLAERYAADSSQWPEGVLDPMASPVDLSALNHTPAGRLGFVRAEGEELVYGDGSPARFWGANLQAYSLYVRGEDGKPNRALIERQARRLAQLGFNLVRLTHIDSDWVSPSLIAQGPTSDRIDDASLDGLFTWIAALKEQGIYILLDMITYRPFKPGDNIPAFEELVRHRGRDDGSSLAEGFSYLNPRIEELWRTTSRELVTRVNPYTGLAVKDDPAVMGIMLWNENDLTQHFGNLFLGDKDTPQHREVFLALLEQFAQRTGLDRDELGRTWEPGAAKMLLADLEYAWYRSQIEFLRGLGVKSLVCAGHVWGGGPLFALPSLAAGDVTDCHSYSGPDFLSSDPNAMPNFAHILARSQQAGRPAFCSEYNYEDSTGVARDPFTAIPYVAALASFQGWDAPMLYGYSQDGFGGWNQSLWSSYMHASEMALMPAAALLYRQGHVQAARETLYIAPSREQLFLERTDEFTSRAIRTGMERHRIVIGMPEVPELPWIEPTSPPREARVVSDLDESFLEAGASVTSDTGELTRDWARGVFTVDTPLSQIAVGWLGGEPLGTSDATFAIASPKAGVALSSLDGQPLRSSRRILLSTIARVDPRMPTRTEPVAGTVELTSEVAGLRLIPLSPDGTRKPPIALTREGDRYRVTLPADTGTLWFLLEAE